MTSLVEKFLKKPSENLENNSKLNTSESTSSQNVECAPVLNIKMEKENIIEGTAQQDIPLRTRNRPKKYGSRMVTNKNIISIAKELKLPVYYTKRTMVSKLFAENSKTFITKQNKNNCYKYLLEKTNCQELHKSLGRLLDLYVRKGYSLNSFLNTLDKICELRPRYVKDLVKELKKEIVRVHKEEI